MSELSLLPSSQVVPISTREGSGKTKRTRQSGKKIYSEKLASKELVSKELVSKELVSKELASKQLASKELASKQLAFEHMHASWQNSFTSFYLHKKITYNGKYIVTITNWNQLTDIILERIAQFIANIFTRNNKISKIQLFQLICNICMSEFSCDKIIFNINDEWPRGDLFVYLVSIGLISNPVGSKYCYPPLLFSLFSVEKNIFASNFLEEYIDLPRTPRTFSISEINSVILPENWSVSLNEVKNFTKLP